MASVNVKKESEICFWFICVAVFLLFFGIISLILLPLEALIGKFSKKRR